MSSLSLNNMDRNDGASKKPAFEMPMLPPPPHLSHHPAITTLSHHPAITTTPSFMAQPLHRPPMPPDRQQQQDMNNGPTSMGGTSVPQSRPSYPPHPMYTMPGPGGAPMGGPNTQNPSPWGSHSQYMSGPCMFNPMGPTANTVPGVPPWGPPPPMVSAPGPTSMSGMGMAGPRPIYGTADQMAAAMYQGNAQAESQQSQQAPQTQQGFANMDTNKEKTNDADPEMPKVLFSPAPIMNVPKEPKKRKPRKKTLLMQPPVSAGQGQEPTSGPGGSGSLPGGSSGQQFNQDLSGMGVGPIGPIGGYGQAPGGPWGQAPQQHINPGQQNPGGPGMAVMPGMNSMNMDSVVVGGGGAPPPPTTTESMSSNMYSQNNGMANDATNTTDQQQQQQPSETNTGEAEVDKKNVRYAVTIVQNNEEQDQPPPEKKVRKKKRKEKKELLPEDQGGEEILPEEEPKEEPKKRRRKKKQPRRIKVIGADGKVKMEKVKTKGAKTEKPSKVIFSSTSYNIVTTEIKEKKKKRMKPKKYKIRFNKLPALALTEDQVREAQSRLSDETRGALTQLQMIQKEIDSQRAIDVANQKAVAEGQLDADLEANQYGAAPTAMETSNSMVGRYSIVDALGTARTIYPNQANTGKGSGLSEEKTFALRQLGMLRKAIAERARYKPNMPSKQEMLEEYMAAHKDKFPSSDEENAEVIINMGENSGTADPNNPEMADDHTPAVSNRNASTKELEESRRVAQEKMAKIEAEVKAQKAKAQAEGKLVIKTEKTAKPEAEPEEEKAELPETDKPDPGDTDIPADIEAVHIKQEVEEDDELPEPDVKKSCSCFSCTKLRSGHCVSKYKYLNIKKAWECKLCNSVFEKKKELNKHMRVSHAAADRPFKCEICAKGFLTDNRLVSHLMKHAGLKPYVCETCGKSFNMKSHLIKHRRVHTGEKPFTCSYCGKSFSENGSLVRHERKHTGEKPYKCEICEKPFSETGSLHRHMKVHEEERPYRCEVCFKSFKTDKPLVAHMMRHVGMRPYICDTCGKSFNMKSHLEKHIRVHTGEKPFKCDMCGRCFSENGSLVRHKKRHLGVRPECCELCGKTFTEKVQLRRHMLTHTGEKPFTCKVCFKSFHDNCNLVTHMRIHTGAKPYKCEQCGRAFNQKGNLVKHRQTHIQTEEKPYKCEFCGKGFTDYAQCVRHTSFHTGDRRFKCDVCGRSFNAKRHLQTHMRIHTGEKPFKCEFCGKHFKHDGSYFKHRRIHTGERPYKCEMCEKTFRENSDLIKHMNVHATPKGCNRIEIHDGMQVQDGVVQKPPDPEDRPYKCDLCGKQFKHELSLVNHWRVHSGDRPYKCDICDKTFKEKGHLSRHVRTHAKGKETKAKKKRGHFGESFPKTEELTALKNIPMVDKPYKCEVCERSFSNNGDLVAHMWVHSGVERPYRVAQMGGGEMMNHNNHSNHNELNVPHSATPHSITPHPHSVTPHSVTPQPHSGPPQSVTPHSITPHSITPHSVAPPKLHPGERPSYKCEVCEMSFREQGDLAAHMWVHSGVERPYRVDQFTAEPLNWNGDLLAQKHPMESFMTSHPIWPNMTPPVGLQHIPATGENSVSSVVHFANSVVHPRAMENKASTSAPVTDASHAEAMWVNHHSNPHNWPK